MSATQPIPQPQHPVVILRAAVIWARAAGIRVRLGSFGVICISAKAAIRWERDPVASGVCPLGAAILHAQPQATIFAAAAAEAICAPRAWLEGYQAGFDREDLPEVWAAPINRRLALAGFEAGSRYREEFIRTRPTVLA